MVEPPVLLNALRTHPDDAEVVTVQGGAISRAGLVSRGLALVESLPGPGPVAVCAEPSLETVIAVTGCVLAGVPVVPVPPDAGAGEIAHLVRDSAADCWVGPTRPGVALPRLDVPQRAPERSAPPPPDPAAPAVILYTSGTTGAPKGAVLSSMALAAGLEALARAWAWSPEDTVVHGLPLFHTHGLVLGVLGPLHLGSRLVHTGRPRPEAYAAARGTLYFGVPTVWSRIAGDAASARALRGARLLVSGSAPLPVPVFEAIEAATGHAPLERYGMTETMITLSARAGGERRPGWVGRPLAGVQTRIRDESGAAVPPDGASVGSLQVRGPMLFDGYLNRPEDTKRAWTDDGWFDTGDMAVVDETGFHRIAGRASIDLIKSGGYRIGAGEIESSLLARPEVVDAAVVGVADADLGQRIVAYVVADGPGPALAERLIEHVAADLSAHKRPREIRFVDALPRNAMGKVLKTALTS